MSYRFSWRLRLLVAAAGLVAAVVLALALPSAFAGTYENCGPMSFQGGTDFQGTKYGSPKVKAKNVSCSKAVKVARAAVDARNFRYSSKGFKCKGEKRPKAQIGWVCKAKKGAGVVRFRSVGQIA